MTNPLVQLTELGQSVWYDNLGREFLRKGELKRLIEDDGVTGVTSNPTIFEKSIREEKTYDADIHELVDLGKTVVEIYESLVIADIRDAADLLLPVYERTQGRDGFVSLEVSPELAYDMEGTLDEAKRLFGLVGRPNLMIKVPATPEGLAAVEGLIEAGVNVNVTLIFSLIQYEMAAEAYIKGMNRWILSGGNPSSVSSVASFFVSRLDTTIDERLNDINNPDHRSTAMSMLGKTAIANAKLAYSLFKEIFHGPRFSDLKVNGAYPQRVLWASTSTKNPDYADTYYIDALIGPETINTIPAATLTAFRDHGQPTAKLENELDQAKAVFPKFEEMGIKTNMIMDQLLQNGIEAFSESYLQLLDGIRRKRARLLRGWGHRSASLGVLQERIEQTLHKCDQEQISEKIWAYDYTIWKDDPMQGAEISHRLGWLHAVEIMEGESERLKEFASEIKSLGFKDAVLLGMGGSSLAAEVFRLCFGVADGYLDLHVLDTTVPKAILDLQRRIDLRRTLFIVSSKSGSTVEVLSLYKYFRRQMEELRNDQAGEHFIAITDPSTKLGQLASSHNFRKVFLNPSDIGGRFSALSYFGLVPAALIGADIDRLLMRASQAVESASPDVPSLENPGLWLGVVLAEALLAGRDKLTCFMSPSIRSFGGWLEQLIAESTGKEGRGIFPVHDEPIGEIETYSDDRLFVYLRIDNEGSHDSLVPALEKAGQPVVTLMLHTPYDLGREIFRWEFGTSVAGSILNINPFNQPNVQEAKDLTNQYLDQYVKEGKLPPDEKLAVSHPDLPKKLESFFRQAQVNDYIAFNAFLTYSPHTVELLQDARKTIRDKFKVATVIGFGPKYLHSTGQIHKGGPNNGLYMLITANDREDIDVPGQPYSFSVLKSCQALGDYEALKKKGRRIMWVHLESEDDLSTLVKVISKIS